MRQPLTLLLTASALPALLAATPALAGTTDDQVRELADRLERLEADNARLRAEMGTMQDQRDAVPAPPPPPPPMTAANGPHWSDEDGRRADKDEPRKAVGISLGYSFDMLDHAEGVNKRLIRQLQARQNDELDSIVTLGGSVVAIANAHFSNRADKFGYLMRHPTPNNQRTKHTQEITLASAQLAFTVTPNDYITAYAELLYDPEQSFGAGTLTALGRNQIQLRKGWVMFGNLNESPLYAAIGKMDVPFGLEDTVSPYTNSTNWHAFAPLAYGGQVGYLKDGLSVRAMAVMGGSQFRGANVPVDGTSIPAKMNNFAVDASYTYKFGEDAQAMLGGSYIHGSAYCQGYPVVHFNPCTDNVPAWSAYGTLNLGRLKVLGEFAQTTTAWPGTQVPDPANPLSQFAASKVTSLTAGGRYNLSNPDSPTNLSLEYSRFQAGPDGAPWHRQNQVVAGLSHRVSRSVDLFGEAIHTDGFAPLNFISGGNQPGGATWSDASARSNVLMLGVQAAF